MRDIRAFCVVVDLGSITGAARALGETKGSVSRRLARLEHTLGVALVRRSPRLVTPTENGVAYRARMGQALELFDEATAGVQAEGAEPSGKLRLTAPTDLGIGLVAPLVARFLDRHPLVTVDMSVTDRRLAFDAHRLDVALRVGTTLEDSTLIAHRLLELEIAFVAAPCYLARRRAARRLTAEELDAHALLLYAGMLSNEPLTLVDRDDPRTSITLRLPKPRVVADGAFIREAAIAGAGVALVPTVVVDRDLADGRLVRLWPRMRVAHRAWLFLLHPAMQFVPAKVRAFREFMTEALGPKPRGRAGQRTHDARD